MTRGTFHCWITTLHLKTTSTTWFVVSSVLLPRHSKTITPKYTTCIQLSLQNPLHFNQHPKILHNKYILIMRMFAMWTSNPPPMVFDDNTIFISNICIYSIKKRVGWGDIAVHLVLIFSTWKYMFLVHTATTRMPNSITAWFDLLLP